MKLIKRQNEGAWIVRYDHPIRAHTQAMGNLTLLTLSPILIASLVLYDGVRSQEIIPNERELTTRKEINTDEYIIDPPEQQELEEKETNEASQLKEMIENHITYTGSKLGSELLANWSVSITKFKKIFPRDYARVIRERAVDSSDVSGNTTGPKEGIGSRG